MDTITCVYRELGRYRMSRSSTVLCHLLTARHSANVQISKSELANVRYDLIDTFRSEE
jgi:hypothetical protein